MEQARNGKISRPPGVCVASRRDLHFWPVQQSFFPHMYGRVGGAVDCFRLILSLLLAFQIGIAAAQTPPSHGAPITLDQVNKVMAAAEGGAGRTIGSWPSRHRRFRRAPGDAAAGQYQYDSLEAAQERIVLPPPSAAIKTSRISSLMAGAFTPPSLNGDAGVLQAVPVIVDGG